MKFNHTILNPMAPYHTFVFDDLLNFSPDTNPLITKSYVLTKLKIAVSCSKATDVFLTWNAISSTTHKSSSSFLQGQGSLTAHAGNGKVPTAVLFVPKIPQLLYKA